MKIFSTIEYGAFQGEAQYEIAHLVSLELTIAVQGKQLEIVEEQAGACRLVYEGRSYFRLGDLPAEARGAFLGALNILQSLVVENR